MRPVHWDLMDYHYQGAVGDHQRYSFSIILTVSRNELCGLLTRLIHTNRRLQSLNRPSPSASPSTNTYIDPDDSTDENADFDEPEAEDEDYDDYEQNTAVSASAI